MNLLLLSSGAVLAASLFFGGSARRDLISDVLPILMSCGLVALAYPLARQRLREDAFLRVLLAGLAALVVVQFIPLPPAVWSALPGRAELMEMYGQTGVAAPWASLALRPAAAAQSALSLLPGLAIFLAVIALDAGDRRKLILILLAAALVSAPVGMLQVMGGSSSPLYFFEVTNHGNAVGFFANRNHYAALYYCAIPLAAAMFASRDSMAGAPLWMLGATAVFVFILGLSLSGSRSAIILGAAAIAASVLYVARAETRALMQGNIGLAAAAGAAILILPLALGVGLTNILQRFEAEDFAADGRWTFAEVTLDAIKSYFPFGAGLGSFQQLYQLREPAHAVIEPIINHAHNDWLEIGLELGLPAWILAAAFIAWLALTFARSIFGDGADERVKRAALVALALLAVHSFWDYPLRTIALSAIFGLCCGLTFAPGLSRASEHSGRRRRRRSGQSSSQRRTSRSTHPA